MTHCKLTLRSILGLLALMLQCACSDTPQPATATVREGQCESPADDSPEYLQRLGCRRDFDALASVPIDANLPGARSVKVVLDQADADALYFQNSTQYPIHYQFASSHLSGGERPIVP